MHLQQLNTYLYYLYGSSNGANYSEDHLFTVAFSSIGLDHFDFRALELEDDTEGFTARHLYWMGLEFPFLPNGLIETGDFQQVALFFSSNIGVGDLGFVETGSFRQADLEQWAGAEADFSYLFFLTNALGIRAQPLRNGSDPGPVGISLDVEQMRTLRGDIDFLGGTDGGFTAIRESLRGEIEFVLYDEGGGGGWALGVEASLYRQRISATAEDGRDFSQNKSGKRVQLDLTKYYK